MSEIDIEQLRGWIGRTETRQQRISPERAAALAATLDHAREILGEVLPPLWHWIYFTPCARQSDLGKDGHPKLGGFLPPVPLPRRMWAGGRLTLRAPIMIGDLVERISEILSIERKQGNQGDLLFITLRHRLITKRGLAIEEEQDLVYREPATSVPVPAACAEDKSIPAAWRDPFLPDPSLLFRYSALTFNAHRIHYDLPYARDEEGYPGLVVQGPLIATLLADRLAAHVPGRLVRFDFRGRAPLIAGLGMNLCGEHGTERGELELWAEGPNGIPAMTAKAVVGT